ncbi:Transcription factor TFIIIC, tau55-related protein [Ascosphaera apis ARSEF 7405]|uniref:Transcription factor TFIIIC, tau55-related protein n=1 Tax=Ascosphaera apis ARSEF 7405 TaxID=392613 RepID=A0A167YE32_9EURO|nr:Transcription factor TFIIIC, tau55-related protein [Ascosphaera apis ARSEF 7405]
MADQEPEEYASDWEYEYLDNETETFYINLDLTTCNGPLRAPRKRAANAQQDGSKTGQAASPNAVESRGNEGEESQQQQQQQQQQEDDEQDNNSGSDQEGDNIDRKGNATNNSNENENEVDRDINDQMEEEEEEEQIQILDLHSLNPIISYRNQIFSCEWADLIGTEMVFMHPEGYLSDLDRLRQTGKYDLLAANSVKILGRKASLVSTTHSRPKNVSSTAAAAAATTAEEGNEKGTSVGRGKGTKRPSNSNQSQFFTRLREIKRSKGENDTIRTSIPQRKYSALYHLSNTTATDTSPPTALTDGNATAAQFPSGPSNQSQPGSGHAESSFVPSASSIAAATSRKEKIKAWNRTGQQLAEVEDLKKRALKGDEEAVSKLEGIMARTVERAAAEARAEEGD